MPAFRVSGSSGQAPTTVWFGTVIDRLNMLVSFDFITTFNLSIAPAHYGNLWNPINSSFGAFTTAPDATTNTAQLIVEDTSNNRHFIRAGTMANSTSFMYLGAVRVTGFFKASGRRVGYRIRTYNNRDPLAFTNTCTVVFDLAGGQVGVAASESFNTVNGACTPIGTQIIAYPNGWFQCIQDCFMADAGGGIVIVDTFLDNGTGTGALSDTYTGDGASGVYVWRTNMMPVAAYSINSTFFFDDFNSVSTIDVNNTLQPGFNWYTGSTTWTNFTGPSIGQSTVYPYPPSQLSVSGSVLTLTGPQPQGGIGLGTAAQVSDVAGTYVGQGFYCGKPLLQEMRLKWDYNTQETLANQTGNFWCSTLEWMVAQGQGAPNNANILNTFPGREYDIVEVTGGDQAALTDTVSSNYIGTQTPGHPVAQIAFRSSNFLQAANGFPPWQPTWDYNLMGPGHGTIMSGGNIYAPIRGAPNINHMPPNATFWTPVTPNAALQAAIQTDFTQFHLYSSLVIPFWGQPGVSKGMGQQTRPVKSAGAADTDPACGCRMVFYDGALVTVAGSWGPNMPAFDANGGTFAFSSDNGHLPLWISADSQPMHYDFIRVMQ